MCGCLFKENVVILGFFNVVIFFVCLQCVLDQGGDGYWVNVVGNWGDVGCVFGGIFIYYVVDYFVVFQMVDVDIDYNCFFFNLFVRNKVWFVYCDDQQVGVFDMMVQVFCKVVGDGGGVVGQQQFYIYWVIDDIGGVNDYCIEVVGVDIVVFQ